MRHDDYIGAKRKKKRFLFFSKTLTNPHTKKKEARRWEVAEYLQVKNIQYYLGSPPREYWVDDEWCEDKEKIPFLEQLKEALFGE